MREEVFINEAWLLQGVSYAYRIIGMRGLSILWGEGHASARHLRVCEIDIKEKRLVGTFERFCNVRGIIKQMLQSRNNGLR